MSSNIFNLNYLINAYHERIVNVCTKIPGEKTLMVHDKISKLLDKICDLNLLRKCGVRNVIKLADYSINATVTKLLCFVPSDYDSVQAVIKFIKDDRNNNITRKMVLAFVPFLTSPCRYLLQQEDVLLENIAVFDLKIGWIPLDDDLLTLDWTYLFPSTFIDKNTTWSYFLGEMLADALIIGLERPTYTCQIYPLGESSKWCFSGLSESCKKNMTNIKSTDGRSGSTNVFIFSRDLDYITPFCLPVTFEGMLHEVIGIELGTVNITEEMSKEPEKKEVMNNTNGAYKAIRHLPMSSVVKTLSEHNQKLKDRKERVGTMNLKNLQEFVSTEIKDVLKEDKDLRSCYIVNQYVLEETTVKDRIDLLMNTQFSILTDDNEQSKNMIVEFLTSRRRTRQFDALRLLCLWTAVYDGLSDKMYKEFYRMICHSFGYPIMKLLHNLRKLRLLAPREDFKEFSSSQNLTAASVPVGINLNTLLSKSRYFNIKSALKLSSNEQISQSDNLFHRSYIFSGSHSPICASLIEEICFATCPTAAISRHNNPMDIGKAKKGVQLLDEAMRHLNLSGDAANGYGKVSLTSGSSVRTTNLETVIVCFVGGCTYAEITALRKMGELNHWNVIILTSAILNTKDLIFQAV